MPYIHNFLSSLLLTLISEIPIVILFVKYFYKNKELKISKIIFTGFLASTLAIPYLWFILPAYIFNRSLYLLVGEGSIVLVEAIIYNRLLKLKLLQAFVVSLIANIVSMLLGLVF